MRNPYPVPDVSTEGDWMPPGPVLANNVSINDRDWWTKVKTHERLFSHHTLTSIRRDHRLIRNDELIPVDALDFALSSIYIHSDDSMVPKMYVPMQPESLNMETWRVLRNEINNSSGQISLSIKSIPTSAINKNHINTRKSSSASYSGSSVKNNTKTKTNKTNKSNKKLQNHSNNNNKKVNKNNSGFSKNKSSGGKSAKSKSHGQSSVNSRQKNLSKGNKQKNNNKLSSIKNKRFKNDEDKQNDSRENKVKKKNFAAQMMAIERIHPSSIKLAIDGPHTDQTNPGFSRKINGTFYSI